MVSKEVVIEIKNLTKIFNDKVIINNVNLKIDKNDIVGIIGRNGSGKTVLLKTISQLYFATSGEIIYAQNLKIQDDFGILIDTGFLDNETGLKNLEILASLKNTAAKKDIYDIMQYVKLDPWNKTKYKNYSTGMKQKLKLAQALMEKPKILILDEPFNGLDKESVKYFREEFIKFKDNGMTIIITSHYQEDIDNLCDIVYEMIDGELKLYEKER